MNETENKYIVLQRPKLKVFLNAGEEPWIAPVGHENFAFGEPEEAILISLIFDTCTIAIVQEITDLLTTRWGKEISPVHIDHFIEYFKQNHVAQKLENCSFQDTTLLGNELDGCSIPFKEFTCDIPITSEKMLIDKIQSNPRNAFPMCQSFFRSYMRERYMPSEQERDVWYYADNFALNFMSMHGLICPATDYTYQSEERPVKISDKDGILITLGVFAFALVSINIVVALTVNDILPDEMFFWLAGVILVVSVAMAVILVVNKCKYKSPKGKKLTLKDKLKLQWKDMKLGAKQNEGVFVLLAIVAIIIGLFFLGRWMCDSQNEIIAFIGFMLAVGPTAYILDKLGLLKRRR